MQPIPSGFGHIRNPLWDASFFVQCNYAIVQIVQAYTYE